MHYADLTPYQHYVPRKIAYVLNVGWLDKQHAFEQAYPSIEVANKLHEILMSDGNLNCCVNPIRGVQPCHLCGTVNFERTNIGSCELWVPDNMEDMYFAAPSTIIHYMLHHHYRPPQVFVDAVIQLKLDKHFIGQNLHSELSGLPKHLWPTSL